VGDGVSHQVAHHLVEPIGIALERSAYLGHPEVAVSEQRQIAPDILEELGEIDRARLDQLACLGTRERQHVAHQPVELVEAAQQRHGLLVTVPLVALAVEQLDLRPQHRQRRAQLVGRVGHELALALERALQSLEHPVKRGCEHRYLSAARDRPGTG
jgi:hypothetical protein